MLKFNRSRPAVKRNRIHEVSAGHRFGVGVLAFNAFAVLPPGCIPPSAADEAWWLSQMNGEGDPCDDPEWHREMDRMAQERAFEDAYEARQMMGPECFGCGYRGPLYGGLCDRCDALLEPEVFGIDGGRCPTCGNWSDFVDPHTGFCPPCDLAASDQQSECQARRAW